jgi:hypothetical protein
MLKVISTFLNLNFYFFIFMFMNEILSLQESFFKKGYKIRKRALENTI